jgi:hypothetical protein
LDVPRLLKFDSRINLNVRSLVPRPPDRRIPMPPHVEIVDQRDYRWHPSEFMQGRGPGVADGTGLLQLGGTSTVRAGAFAFHRSDGGRVVPVSQRR